MIISEPSQKCLCGEKILDGDSPEFIIQETPLFYIFKECNCGIVYHFVFSFSVSIFYEEGVNKKGEMVREFIKKPVNGECCKCGSENMAIKDVYYSFPFRNMKTSIDLICRECYSKYVEKWTLDSCYVNDRYSKKFVAQNI